MLNLHPTQCMRVGFGRKSSLHQDGGIDRETAYRIGGSLPEYRFATTLQRQVGLRAAGRCIGVRLRNRPRDIDVQGPHSPAGDGEKLRVVVKEPVHFDVGGAEREPEEIGIGLNDERISLRPECFSHHRHQRISRRKVSSQQIPVSRRVRAGLVPGSLRQVTVRWHIDRRLGFR